MKAEEERVKIIGADKKGRCVVKCKTGGRNGGKKGMGGRGEK